MRSFFLGCTSLLVACSLIAGCDSSPAITPPEGQYSDADERLMVEYMVYGEGFDRADIVILDSTIVVEGDMLFDKAALWAFLQQNPAAAAAARAGNVEGLAQARLEAKSNRQGTFDTGPLRWEHADGLGASTSGITVYARSSVPS